MSPHHDALEPAEHRSHPGALLRTEGLNKIYHGAVPTHALRDVTLSIDAGEMLALVGPSGSGKSTLMNILGCLDRPSSGSYWLAGKLLTEYTEDALADIRNREIGFVFQSFNLLPRYSALQNVALPLLYGNTRGEDPKRLATEALERVGLGEKLSSRPNELSGGQKQRVAIARAIINRPRIVFADEPTGALDTATSAEIMALFHELNQSGITMLLVTHEPEIAAECRRIIRMRDGRIVSDEATP